MQESSVIKTQVGFGVGTVLKRIFGLLLILTIGFGVQVGWAQQATPAAPSANQAGQVWSEPVNLSQSGAASQPHLVATTDGRMQAFWWDRFDGLVTSIYEPKEGDKGSWSTPQPAPIQSKDLKAIPNLLVDFGGRIHAFWTEADQSSGAGLAGAQPQTNLLKHSEMDFGSTTWSNPELLSDSALVYSVAPAKKGGVSVAYIRTLNSSDKPAGIYFTQKVAGIKDWSPRQAVYTSIYLRLLTLDEAYIRLAELPGQGNDASSLYLAWNEPRSQQVQFTSSTDGGKTWTAVGTFGDQENPARNMRLAVLADGKGILRIWETGQTGSCVLMQQSILVNSPSGKIDLSNTSTAWSTQSQILGGLTTCPKDDNFIAESGGMLWVWSEGSANLSISFWHPTAGAWSPPQTLNTNFQDPKTGESVALSDLYAKVVGQNLTVIGWDQDTGEIWSTSAQSNVLGLTYASASPWTPPVRLTADGQVAQETSLVEDSSGLAYMVWSGISQKNGAQGSTASLFYSQELAKGVFQAVEIFPAAEGDSLTAPALLLESQTQSHEERLHLVWQDQVDGKIWYSRVGINEASSASDWSPAIAISGIQNASRPQIGIDASGRLFVIFIVRLNESRGVYLVRSDDHGDHWSSPIVVFDGAKAGWQMVDHPTLAVSPDGSLHAAWVQSGFPGTGIALSIYYARSGDGGSTWSAPLTVAGKDFDLPRLVLSGDVLNLFFTQSGQGIFYRQVALNQQNEDGSGWGVTANVPGLRDVSNQFGITASAESLELVSLASNGSLVYSALIKPGQGSNNWLTPETIASPVQRSLNAAASSGEEAWLAAALQAQKGSLAVLWPVTSDLNKASAAGLYLIKRAVATEAASQSPTSLPPVIPATVPVIDATPTPAAATSITATPTPTELPVFNRAALPAQAAIPPFAVGGGIAALIVISILTGWAMRLSLRRRIEH